jgi:hypothetical protein
MWSFSFENEQSKKTCTFFLPYLHEYWLIFFSYFC